MKAKLKKDFQFNLPRTAKKVRDLRIVTVHLGDLEIEGTAYCNPNASALDSFEDRYTVDIDFVKFNGADIKDIIEDQPMMDEIHDAALQHAVKLFTLPRLAQSIASELSDLEDVERRLAI